MRFIAYFIVLLYSFTFFYVSNANNFEKYINYYKIIPFDHNSKKIRVKIMENSFLAIIFGNFSFDIWI